MSKWGMVRLGDAFLSINNGVSIKQGDELGSGLPITRIETIADGTINRNKLGYAGIEDATKYSNYILNTGDILMSHINSVKHLGKTALYKKLNDETIIHGMNLLRLQASQKKLDSKYANYFFNSPDFRLQLPRITKNSVNQSSFTVTAFKELLMPLPPLPIQQKIASVLDKASALIEKRKAQINKLDLLIKSQFIEMFGDPVTNPMGWKFCELSEVATSRLGKMLDAKQQTGKHRYPYLANFNVQWFSFDFSDLNEMDFNEADQLEFALKKGDLLICEGGEVGRCAIWKEDIQPCFFQKALHRVRCDTKTVLPEYLARWFYLRSQYNQFKDIVGQATIAHLPGVKLKQLKIVVPPISLQKEFATFVERIEEQRKILQHSLEKLELNYKSLMQKCFRGEMF